MHPESPAIFSIVRIGSLLASLLVALGSGTNYAFSAYGPQLASRLHLSHTRLNVISLSGTVGVYGTAPLMGKLVDARGPRPLMVIAFFSLLVGYSGIRHFYVQGLPDGASGLSNWVFAALMACGFFTGVGGTGGIMSATNATAKSFPHRARATTTGLVFSMFGLSAFIFSTVGHTLFLGDIAGFLLTLAVGTSLPMILGFFFVRSIPLPTSEHDIIYSGEDADDVHTPLFGHQELSSSVESSTATRIHPHSASADYVISSSSSTQSERIQSNASRRDIASTSKKGSTGPVIRGLALAVNGDFWLLFVITIFLTGTGLMCNVGLISQALYANAVPTYDEREAAKWQSAQVSTVSISNCLGRIIIGVIADSSHHLMETPRSSYISFVALLFVISQTTAFAVNDVTGLWKASALLGLSYGSLFGLFPAVTIEWFGLPHFSENWGFMSLAPVIGSNILSIAFGRIFDAHSRAPTPEPRSPISHTSSPSESHSMCFEGRACYADSLKLTIAACTCAFALGVYAGIRDWRRQKGGDVDGGARTPIEDERWEEV
ncbi:unnamed protein product [Somion occarium]|uniref:MFS general substrate transporter n=1 Tax=Somion occarium TaxID=3059160 RepID=A0ABP1DZJ8_9APHY